MIDFHSHVLPRMDDGSKSLEMSTQMLQESIDQGVSTLVITPHFYPHKESPNDFFLRRDKAMVRLSKAFDDLPADFILHLGCELHYYDGISRMEYLEDCCILGTSTLLLEMPFVQWGQRMMSEIDAIQRRGIQPVLAHVERYFPLHNKKQLLSSLRDMGVYNQISADYFEGGLKGMHAMHMFRDGDVHVLGSDCHNMSSRPPNMGPTVDKLSRKFGDRAMDSWSECGESLLSDARIF